MAFTETDVRKAVRIALYQVWSDDAYTIAGLEKKQYDQILSNTVADPVWKTFCEFIAYVLAGGHRSPIKKIVKILRRNMEEKISDEIRRFHPTTYKGEEALIPVVLPGKNRIPSQQPNQHHQLDDQPHVPSSFPNKKKRKSPVPDMIDTESSLESFTTPQITYDETKAIAKIDKERNRKSKKRKTKHNKDSIENIHSIDKTLSSVSTTSSDNNNKNNNKIKNKLNTAEAEEESNKMSEAEKLEYSRQEREKFQKEKKTILSAVPKQHQALWGQLGFAKWGKHWRPIVLQSPYMVPPMSAMRVKWMRMFENCRVDRSRMTYICYWYGTKDEAESYSFEQRKKICMYEDGVRRGYDKTPIAIQKKIDKEKKLTTEEQELVQGLEVQKEQLQLPPEKRYLTKFKEVYELLLELDDVDLAEHDDDDQDDDEVVEPLLSDDDDEDDNDDDNDDDDLEEEEEELGDNDLDLSRRRQTNEVDEDLLSSDDDVEMDHKAKSDDRAAVISDREQSMRSLILREDSEGENELHNHRTEKTGVPEKNDLAPKREKQSETKVKRRQKIDDQKRKPKVKDDDSDKEKLSPEELQKQQKRLQKRLREREHTAFRRCRQQFTECIEKFEHAIDRGDPDTIVTCLRKFGENLDMLTAPFIEVFELAQLMKKTKSILKSSSKASKLRKDVWDRMKELYEEKKATVPPGFQPPERYLREKTAEKSAKPAEKLKGNNSVRDHDGTKLGKARVETNHADTPYREERIPTKDNSSAKIRGDGKKKLDNGTNQSSISDNTQANRVPRRSEGSAKDEKSLPPKPVKRKKKAAASLKNLLANSNKSTTTQPPPKTVVQQKSINVNRSNNKKKMPAWLTSEPPKDESFELSTARKAGFEFLSDAASHFPPTVNGAHISRAIEAALYSWAHDNPKSLSQPWQLVYFEKLHGVIAALTGKWEGSQLMKDLLSGKLSSAKDVAALSIDQLEKSFLS